MKRIVIIGASSGIGRRIATDFARYGWRVGAAARNTEALTELKALYPDNIEYAGIDVTAPDVEKKLYDLIETIGGMDIILYCAGCGWYNPELDSEDDERTIAVNVGGMTKVCIAAYKYFRDTANVDKGRIAVITSVAGTKGLGVSAAYSASKSYQQKYLQALDQLAHIQHVNVGITDIRPGFVDTGLLKRTPARDLPMVMSLDYAAPRIELAILRGRRVATIDSRWAVVNTLWRMIPGCLWPHLQFKV
ncbi:MAG: SDR family NAD(P)-dependent oxidoreductase [Muribaculaceae bacterium]|nr:SDR family NAD(P)-dependent oxidoreductase [Muribaculaceae bacterium]